MSVRDASVVVGTSFMTSGVIIATAGIACTAYKDSFLPLSMIMVGIASIIFSKNDNYNRHGGVALATLGAWYLFNHLSPACSSYLIKGVALTVLGLGFNAWGLEYV